MKNLKDNAIVLAENVRKAHDDKMTKRKELADKKEAAYKMGEQIGLELCEELSEDMWNWNDMNSSEQMNLVVEKGQPMISDELDIEHYDHEDNTEEQDELYLEADMGLFMGHGLWEDKIEQLIEVQTIKHADNGLTHAVNQLVDTEFKHNRTGMTTSMFSDMPYIAAAGTGIELETVDFQYLLGVAFDRAEQLSEAE